MAAASTRALLATRCAHAGCDAGMAKERDVVAPLHLSTNYERDAEPGRCAPAEPPKHQPRGSDGGVSGYPNGYCYSRLGNPTRHLLERELTALEGGADAQAYASGMAAAAALLGALAPDDHVVFGKDLYAGVKGVRQLLCDARGIKWTAADASSAEDVAAAVTPATKLVWVESIGNPLATVADIRGIRAAVGDGPVVVVDATWATPFVSRPLLHGADVVLQSLTKYLGGHSDCLGGALVRREGEGSSLLKRVWAIACNTCTIAGSALDPFSCFLVTRGIRSLAPRIKTHSANALAVASFLQGHPSIARVRYPGLPTDPGHAILRRHGVVAKSEDEDDDGALFGGMLSFELKAGADAALATLKACKLCIRATSLGGTETLLEHRQSVEGFAGVSETPGGLVRMSVGLEDAAAIVGDLAQALACV